MAAWICRHPGRGLLWASLVTATLAALAAPLTAALPTSREIAFHILRNGDPIGHHSVTFRRQDGRLLVAIEIDIEVRFAFLTLFRYRHENREAWREGRLVALDSWTDDDGTRYEVTARATPEGVRVEGRHGTFLAPAQVIPTSYWNAATVRQTRLLDTQYGRLVDVAVRPVGEDSVARGGEEVQARKYIVSGDLDLEVWYTPQGEWAKIAFEARGAEISYTPVAE